MTLKSSLQGEVALVTGGSKGIGKAIAERFRYEGVTVVVADHVGKTSGDPQFVRTDVSREAQVRRCIKQVIRSWGRLDILVNNAGISDPESGFDVKSWNRIIGVNLTGAFLCAKYAVPHLKKTKGRIINIASTRALMSEPETQAYSATKGGLVALTHSLAITLGPRVLVNCISPGWINTKDEKLRPIDLRQHPAGRVGRPEDVAALATFLISPEAAFITGQNYIIDGGMTRKMIYAT